MPIEGKGCSEILPFTLLSTNTRACAQEFGTENLISICGFIRS